MAGSLPNVLAKSWSGGVPACASRRYSDSLPAAFRAAGDQIVDQRPGLGVEPPAPRRLVVLRRALVHREKGGERDQGVLPQPEDVLDDRQPDPGLVLAGLERAVVLGEPLVEPERQGRVVVVHHVVQVLVIDDQPLVAVLVAVDRHIVGELPGEEVAAGVEGAAVVGPLVRPERSGVAEDEDIGGDRRIERQPRRELGEGVAEAFEIGADAAGLRLAGVAEQREARRADRDPLLFRSGQRQGRQAEGQEKDRDRGGVRSEALHRRKNLNILPQYPPSIGFPRIPALARRHAPGDEIGALPFSNRRSRHSNRRASCRRMLFPP